MLTNWWHERCLVDGKQRSLNAMHGRASSCSCRPLFVQACADLANINPHLHVLAADGVFGSDGTFTALPPVPEALLVEGFRQEVLAFLVKEGAISDELRVKMLVCPKCRSNNCGPMREIALIDDPTVVRRILDTVVDPVHGMRGD